MSNSSEADSFDQAVDDDRSPMARLRRAELRAAHLEGQVEALRAQIAALEAADEHRRTELAGARDEVAEAEAAAREARARAEERRHLIDELREQLSDARAAGPAREADDGGAVRGWLARRNRS